MIRHHKVVAALPTPLEADSVYYVRAGAGVDIYVTNSTGLIASYKPNYQAANANLDALAGLTGAADRVPYFTGAGALSLATLTAFGRNLLALVDGPAARTLLSLSPTDNVTFGSLLFNAFTKIYPESNGIKIQLGSTTAATGYITIKSTGELVLESAGLTVGGSLLPKTTTILFGSPAFPWNIGYFKTVSLTGATISTVSATVQVASAGGLLLAQTNTVVPSTHASNAPKGLSVYRESENAEVSLLSNLDGYSTMFRATSFKGTLSAPTATADLQLSGLAFQGYDGTSWTGPKALVIIGTLGAWSTTSTPTRITFSTTAIGSTACTDRWQIGPGGNFAPMLDNAYSLGAAAVRASVVYAGTGVINTSDSRFKTPVRGLSSDEVSAAIQVAREIGFYKFLDSISEKGEAARDHCGMTVQRVIEIFRENGLDPFLYSFICYDSWDEETITHPERRDGEGNIESPASTEVIPGGDRYSFRESGLLMFIAAGFEARLSKIEALA